jgi:hypothetical protein
MLMDRYIGLDVHSASCTAGVLSAKGRRLSSTVLETNGKALVEYLRLIPGTRRLIIEEGTQAAWLHEILSPHVHELVVMGAPKTKGQKNDKLDAFGLAEKLRTGSIERRVYKSVGEFSVLASMSKGQSSVSFGSRDAGTKEKPGGTSRRRRDVFHFASGGFPQHGGRLMLLGDI